MSTRSQTAILFPGQGVGDASARELVAEVRPDLLEQSVDLLGEDPFARIADSTRFAQPAVYCASIAGFELLGRPRAEYYAGHSLGEIGALAASGAIRDEDGLRLVIARGRAMEAAAGGEGEGGMLAVGTDRRRAEELAAANGLTVANENSPAQFVLSGPVAGVERAELRAKSLGARAKRLAVAGAFHTEAIRPAVAHFRAALETVDFRDVPTRAISSSTVAFFGSDVRDALAAALTTPVRWTGVMRRLRHLGVTRFVDVGPGKVLAGLVRKTLPGVEVETIRKRESALA
jgi:malonyl CoA-acyl carrier protein transacylase